jgi:hypothetical protein
MVTYMLNAVAQSSSPAPLPVASPSPSPELLGPIEAFKRFLEGISATEASWIITALLLVLSLYLISIQQLRSRQVTYKNVLLWIAALCGWAFLLFIFGWARVMTGGILSVSLGLLSALFAFIAVFILRNKSADWQQIISGTILIIIGFTIASTIAVGADALSYGMFFGCLFGMITGMLLISIQRLNSGGRISGKAGRTGEGDEWSDERPENL